MAVAPLGTNGCIFAGRTHHDDADRVRRSTTVLLTLSEVGCVFRIGFAEDCLAPGLMPEGIDQVSQAYRTVT